MEIFLESEIFLSDLLASAKAKCCYKTCRKRKMLFENYRDFGYNNSQVTCSVCFFNRKRRAFKLLHLILITQPAIILFCACLNLYSFFVINWPDYGFFIALFYFLFLHFAVFCLVCFLVHFTHFDQFFFLFRILFSSLAGTAVAGDGIIC